MRIADKVVALREDLHDVEFAQMINELFIEKYDIETYIDIAYHLEEVRRWVEACAILNAYNNDEVEQHNLRTARELLKVVEDLVYDCDPYYRMK